MKKPGECWVREAVKVCTEADRRLAEYHARLVADARECLLLAETIWPRKTEDGSLAELKR